MSKFRIKTDEEEETCFYLEYTVGTVRIGACKGKSDAIIAKINAVTGSLSLSPCREEVFIDLGIDYKKKAGGSFGYNYVWNVEEE